MILIRRSHLASLSRGERKRDLVVLDQVSMEGAGKRPVVLQASLGQAQSDV
jgi:hypothetical protein